MPQARRFDLDPTIILDKRQLAAREPGIAMDVAGAVYFPLDCHLSPGRLMAVAAQKPGRNGRRVSLEYPHQ